MRKIYLLLLAIPLYFTSIAQDISSYSFATHTNIPLADMNGANEVFGANADEQSSPVLNLPFSFTFNGNVYNQFSISVDGHIALGPTQVVTDYRFDFISQVQVFPSIAPWFEDLFTGADGGVSYKFFGVPGKRKVVIQWKVCSFEDNINYYNKTFQVWLTEENNAVYYVFGNGTVDWYNDFTNGYATSPTQVSSINFNTHSIVHGAEVTNYNIWPGNGRAYIFSPEPFTVDPQPLPVDATVSFTNSTCSANNGAINISNAAGGNGQYEYSIDGTNWQGSTSFIALAPGTYTVYIRDAADITNQKNLGVTTIQNVGTIPVVSLSTSSNPFCTTIVVSATADAGTSLTWSNGTVGNDLTLSSTDADGVYTVTATKDGCSNTATYTYNKQNELASYVMVSNSISLGENNIITGSVGNQVAGDKVVIGSNSVVNGFVKASQVILSQPVSITGGIYYAPAILSLPPIQVNNVSTSGLSNYTAADNATGTINGNFGAVTIGRRANIVLTGNVFGRITVREGATVQFTSADVSFEGLYIDNSPVTPTTINFVAGASIKVRNRITMGDRNTINGNGAVFYLSDNNNNPERVSVSGRGVTFNGNIMMPKGLLVVKGGDATAPNKLTGKFICDKISSENFVNWNTYVCNSETTGANQIVSENEFLIAHPASSTAKVYPNPSNGNFSINLGNIVPGNAEVTVFTQAGSIVYNKQVVLVDQGQLINVNLRPLSTGIYLVKVKTPSGVKVTTVVIK